MWGEPMSSLLPRLVCVWRIADAQVRIPVNLVISIAEQSLSLTVKKKSVYLRN